MKTRSGPTTSPWNPSRAYHFIARTDGLAANHAMSIRITQLGRAKRIVRLKSTNKPAKAKEKGAIPKEESILKLITLPNIAGGVCF